MERKKYFKIVLVIVAICLLTLPSVQGALRDIPETIQNDSNEEDISETKGTIQYSNCVVWITGNCKSVGGTLTWIFGFFCPLFKKHLWIQASGQEGEVLNVLVTSDGIGTYYDQEHIRIEMFGATGIMYWYGKSWFLEGDRIFARCKADTCLVTI
ncbi:MAG: hypothetical protein KAW45_07940 [Thermoplasmatales archaeon]|nr:hypothetical protein [Thermoplasmatales archaeon]